MKPERELIRNLNVQDVIGHDPLQASVLVPQGPEFLQFVDLHRSILLLPAVRHRFAEVHFPQTVCTDSPPSIRHKINTICSGVCFFPFWHLGLPFFDSQTHIGNGSVLVSQVNQWWIKKISPVGVYRISCIFSGRSQCDAAGVDRPT